MKLSARFSRTSLTAALLCASLAVNASALSYGAGTVTADSLRLRESADTGSDILTSAAEGTQVIVLEDQTDGWYKVAYDGSVGYMSADYLSVSVQADGKLGAGIVSTDGASLNMRSGPGSDYDKVASIPNGASLTITGIENGWYKTSYKSTEGYVSSDYITLSGSTTKTGVVSTDGASLNMRSGPGSDYDKVASIPNGAVLTLTGKTNGWYQTSYNGQTGYISADYVQQSSGSSSKSSGSSSSKSSGSSSSKSSGSAAPANASLASQLIAYAKQFLGVPYVYGADGPKSFDCSGFTSYVFKHFGYSLNRSAAGQYKNGTSVDISQIQPGDLILWRSYSSSKTATHVGIYMGNDQYIHASSTKDCITISSLSAGSSSRYVVGIRRIL